MKLVVVLVFVVVREKVSVGGGLSTFKEYSGERGETDDDAEDNKEWCVVNEYGQVIGNEALRNRILLLPNSDNSKEWAFLCVKKVIHSRRNMILRCGGGGGFVICRGAVLLYIGKEV